MIMSETHDVYVLYQISNNYFVIDGSFIRPGFFLHPIQYSNLLCLNSVWHEKDLTLNYHPQGVPASRFDNTFIFKQMTFITKPIF